MTAAEWGGFTHIIQDIEMVKTHIIPITELAPNTRYYFVVGSMDVAGNGPGVNDSASNPSAVNSFRTTDIADETSPSMSNIEVVHVTDTTALIEWETDEPSNSMVQYDRSSQVWGDYQYGINDSEMVISHSVTITGLEPETPYYYRVASTDADGNGPNLDSVSNPSKEHRVVTEAEPDEVAPQISNVTIVLDEAEKEGIVEWETNEPGNSQVRYDTSSQEWGAYGENNPALTREHRVILTNLDLDVPYYIRVGSVDASGNSHDVSEEDDNPSPEYIFQLGAEPTRLDPVQISPTINPPHDEQTTGCFIGTILY